jgi:hypothetical protein
MISKCLAKLPRAWPWTGLPVVLTKPSFGQHTVTHLTLLGCKIRRNSIKRQEQNKNDDNYTGGVHLFYILIRTCVVVQNHSENLAKMLLYSVL